MRWMGTWGLAGLLALGLASAVWAQSPLDPLYDDVSIHSEFDLQGDMAEGEAASSPMTEGPDAMADELKAVPESDDEPEEEESEEEEDKDVCDEKKIKAVAKKVATAHKIVFYNNDFSYFDDPCYPCYGCWWPGDHLKRIPLPCCGTLDLGGQYRARYHHEQNMRGLGLTGRDDDFLLHRTRLYADAKFHDRFRVFAEYLDAESNYENFPPRAIEVNRSDFLNLFADVKVWDGWCNESLTLRAGRQELLYGNQRTISPLDWANTRRTFEGYKAFYKSDDWDVDAFYVRPMRTLPTSFDSPDYDQEFMGVYSVYKGIEKMTYDFYYIGLNNAREDFNFDTWGTRVYGPLTCDESWLYEVEGAFQTGDYRGFDHATGFYTVGLGRKWDDHCWKPTVWAYYDWAGGSDLIGNGYHHLFPLGHKYMGFMDLFGRRNLETPNVQVTAQPCEKLTLLAWYYYFFLEDRDDVPYTIQMTPFNPNNRPASADLGHEIDLLATIAVNARTEVQFGYSHFFAGDYYKLTPGVPHRGDADFFYSQLQFNF